MYRGLSGSCQETNTVGELVRSFRPALLPPNPPLVLGKSLLPLLETASLALGRLDGISAWLPDKALFIYAYVRREAVLSSQIEGTQSSLSDLLVFESKSLPGAPIDDVVEVSNHVAALEHGLDLMQKGLPLSSRLLRRVHEVLLSSGRGGQQDPGQFRRSQNWIGGTCLGNAHFVPPVHTAVADCMSELERFIHNKNDGLPILVRVALSHVQFETIHPFLDGNGRVGRVLITLMLINAGVLRDPLLYLSLYFKTHRSHYYELLDQVRRTGDWEAWIEFFLKGVLETATGAVEKAQGIRRLFEVDKQRIKQFAGGRTSSSLRVHDALMQRHILSLTQISEVTGLHYDTVDCAMTQLVEARIAREITGKRRFRLFAYSDYVSCLTE